ELVSPAAAGRERKLEDRRRRCRPSLDRRPRAARRQGHQGGSRATRLRPVERRRSRRAGDSGRQRAGDVRREAHLGQHDGAGELQPGPAVLTLTPDLGIKAGMLSLVLVVLAQPMDLYGSGPRNIAMAGVQAAADDDYTATYYNPALLHHGSVGVSFNYS